MSRNNFEARSLSLRTSQAFRRTTVLAAAAAGVLAANPLMAQVWTGGALDNLWASTGNWNPASVPNAIDAIADFSQYNLTANTTVTLGANRTVGTLHFGDPDTSSAGNWTLSGNELTLAVSSGSPKITVDNNVQASIGSLFKVASGVEVIKDGAGKVIFTNTSNANAANFGGTLVIKEGTFEIDNTGALPWFDPSAIRLDGGTFRYTGANNSGRAFTLGAGGGTIEFAHGTNNINLGNGAGVTGYHGTGARTLTLLNNVAARSYTFGASLADADASSPTSLVKSGAGGFSVTGAANSYTATGDVTVNAGALTINNNTAAAISNGNITVNGGSLTIANPHGANNISLSGGGSLTARNLGTGPVTTATGTALTINRVTGAQYNSGVAITGGGNFFQTTGDSVYNLTGAAFTGTTAIRRGVYVNNNANTSNIVLGSAFVPADTGTLALTGDFTNSLGTSGGGVSWHVDGVNFGSGGFAVLDAGITRVVNLGGAGAQVTQNSGGFYAGGTAARLAFGTVDQTNAPALGTVDFQNPIELNGRQLSLYANGSAQYTAILSGAITGTVGTALSKSGAGNVLLTGTNTYTGETVVGGGALVLGSAGALSANTRVSFLNSGVLGLAAGDYTNRYIGGAVAGDTGWAPGHSGGFAAFGGNRQVTLLDRSDDSTAALTWATGGAPYFVSGGQSLILGHALADGTLTFNNPINLNGAARTVIANNGSAAVDGVLAGVLSGTGSSGLVKSGAGTLALTNANTYAGVTSVSAGTLLVNGSVAGGATVAAGATLGGTGTVYGGLAVTGTLAPGNSPGSLEVDGNLTLNGASTTAIELGGTAFTLNSVEEYDRVKLIGVGATHTLAGALNVSLVNSFTLGADQAFGIIQVDNGLGTTIGGKFAGLLADGDLVGTFGGENLYITYSGNFGDSGLVSTTGGNDVVLYTVPEPASLSMLALAGIATLRRRRRGA